MLDRANTSLSNLPSQPDDCEVVHELMGQCLAGGELVVPLLPVESTQLDRDLLVADAAFRDLGLSAADGEPLFDSAAAINAELDRYLVP